VVQKNVPAGAKTMLAFKVEQLKVPEFFRQKCKDTISAIIFIRRNDDLARTNNWNDITTYTNVANNLRGFGHDWLFATLQHWRCLTGNESQAKISMAVHKSI
jgi:hypothetical protein